MTKTVCDICGKDVYGIIYSSGIEEYQFSISANGRKWDLCSECREDFCNWVKNRKENIGADSN